MKATTLVNTTGQVVVGYKYENDEMTAIVKTTIIYDVVVINYDAMGATLFGRIDADAIDGVTHVIARGVDYEIGSQFEDRYVIAKCLERALWAPLGSIMRIEAPTGSVPVEHDILEPVLAGWLVSVTR